MKHYTYLITNTTALTGEKYYIGVRSCYGIPEEDIKYMGSSKYLNEDIDCIGNELFIKTILCVFDTREEANLHEIELHALFNVQENDLFYNRHNSRTETFTWAGHSHSEKTKTVIKEKRRQQITTEDQIAKCRATWENKSSSEMEEYRKFRKELWEQKSEEEKNAFQDKMVLVTTEQWKERDPESIKARSKKAALTRQSHTPEQQEQEFTNRSRSQKEAKNKRTPEAIQIAASKRLETIAKLSPEDQQEIQNKRLQKIKGRKWYNNGKISKMFFEIDAPDGFLLGRLK